MHWIKSPIFIFSIVIGIFVVYAGVVLVSIWPIDSKSISQAGVFGDSFGILTSLFSGLAFAGLIITIWQQQEELSITRNEIRVQHFENLLFKMIEIHNGILAEMDIRVIEPAAGHKSGDIICTGRECFNDFYSNLAAFYEGVVNEGGVNEGIDTINRAYSNVWDFHKRDLGHYFRYLYNIFKFINTADIENKTQYSNVVRAQLSEYELALLFYNGLSSKGSEKFKPLIEKFHLLNNLPEELLLDKSHKDFYDPSAYL